ncbi:putative ankyrin-repeat protein, partial [Plasmodium gaboni]
MATEERVKLLVAARKGIYEDVVSLSKLQIPLGDYVQPPHNRTALWYSCRNGSLKMARLILKKGSNINHKDSKGMSPLHICVKYGHINIAKFLIENKADIDIKDNIVKLLIENGADVQIKDNNKASVYDYADFNGKTQLSTYILYK